MAALGHAQMLVIGDAGLPAPPGVPCIDLAVRAGVPNFWDGEPRLASQTR